MNKTCILTGATSGIGYATALKLAESNVYEKVILLGRSIDRINDLALKFKNIVLIECDLENLDIIPNLIEDIKNSLVL